ncbi:MAG: beta-N-acetylhexosaminidase [Methylomicrobium sp.]
MTINSAIGPIMLDVEGLTLTAHERDKINHPNTGAVILFSRNYDNLEQLDVLVKAIRKARQGPILIAVDQEGGRVQRLKEGFTRLPPANCYRNAPNLAEAAGWLMASEILAADIDFSFAPVLDVDCGISEVIGDRSFSNAPKQVAELAAKFRNGMRSAGMAATGKHFPGHGAVAADSHLALPIDERDWETILTNDLLPFQTLIEQGLEAIMPAHVVYPAIDDKPAGFSEKWLLEILRAKLRFNGAIFSDDLSMEGAAFAGDFPDRAVLAQQAGCDMILVCNHPDAAERVLDSLPIRHDRLREQRLLSMRGQCLLTREQLQASAQWQHVKRQIEGLSNDYA